MFEDISEAPKREGMRGFIGRHFGPVTDADEAREELRSIASLFSVLACIGAVLGAIRLGFVGAVDGIVIAGLALLLRFVQSRIAATVLLLLTTINAAISFPAFIPIAWVGFALRALQLTFSFHRLSKALAPEELAATLASGDPSRSVPPVEPYAPPAAFHGVGTAQSADAVDSPTAKA